MGVALPLIGLAAAGATGFAAPAAGLASTLATVGMGASALGGLTGAIGAEQSASAQQATAQYQAQVAANNEQIAKQAANQTAAAGAEQVEAEGIKTKAQVGALKAQEAAGNVDVNSGSNVDVRSSAAELGELNALTLRSNTAQRVYGYQTQSTSFAGQESLAKSEAANAGTAGNIGALSSLLGGASGVSNQYLSWQRAAGNSGAGSTGFQDSGSFDNPTALF